MSEKPATAPPAIPGLISKSLTIHQPFAWSVVCGIKKVENRTWRTNYRGRIAIHSSQSVRTLEAYDELEESFWRVPAIFEADNVDIEEPEGTPLDRPFTLGAIIGTAILLDCIDLEPRDNFESLVQSLPGWQPQLGDTPILQFATGPICWILAAPERLLDPIPCRGKQGLWDLTPQAQTALHHSRRKLLTNPSDLPNLTEQEKVIEREWIESHKPAKKR